jgi:ABC-type Fe3+-hydroxamate transport system substrate-binding protein
MLVTPACSKETKYAEAVDIDNQVSEEYHYTFTDALGQEVVLDKKPERVVSLLGSYSETWVLAGGSLAGVTDDVQKEGRMEITNDMQIVGTVKEPNLEGILSLNPDFVLLSPDVDKQVKIVDSSIVPKITGAPYVDISKTHAELPEFDKDEKLLLVCDKGKRSYMLQQRLKDLGYTNTLVLEAGTMFNELK